MVHSVEDGLHSYMVTETCLCSIYKHKYLCSHNIWNVLVCMGTDLGMHTLLCCHFAAMTWVEVHQSGLHNQQPNHSKTFEEFDHHPCSWKTFPHLYLILKFVLASGIFHSSSALIHDTLDHNSLIHHWEWQFCILAWWPSSCRHSSPHQNYHLGSQIVHHTQTSWKQSFLWSSETSLMMGLFPLSLKHKQNIYQCAPSKVKIPCVENLLHLSTWWL